MHDLAEQHCKADAQQLNDIQIQQLKAKINTDWNVAADRKSLTRKFSLRNYYETVALINAIAQIAHHQDHHPDISFGYRDCTVTWSTHSVGGLSLNDFICAAKVDLVHIL